MKLKLTLSTVTTLFFLSSAASAWNDATHMAVVKAAGLDDYAYLAVGPDIAKQKSGGHEEGNHYRDNKRGTVVTVDVVLDQVQDYNCRCSGKGQLYGAIVAACDLYIEKGEKDKYDRYEFAYLAHYIADLSQPLHNIDYDDFNKTNHMANDAAVEPRVDEATDAKVARIAAAIKLRMKEMPSYRLPSARNDVKGFNRALAGKVAEIANRAMALGYSMEDAKPQRRVMTEEEAYRQLAQSALLLKAAYSAMHR